MTSRLVILMLLLAGPAQAAPSFTGVGDLPGGVVESRAFDVSADGSVVVGHSSSAFSETLLDIPLEPFIWENGEIRSLGPVEPSWPLGFFGAAVSGDGSTLFVGGFNNVFRWTEASGFRRFPSPPSNEGQAFLDSRPAAVSFDGSIVTGDADVGVPFAYTWTEAAGLELLELPTIEGAIQDARARGITADGRTIVGGVGSDPRLTARGALRWDDGVLSEIVDTSGQVDLRSGFATDITPDGSVIVGRVEDRSLGEVALFRWEDGVAEIVSSNVSFARFEVSADGRVIVGASDGEAILWDPVGGQRAIAELLTEELGLDLSGWTLTEATGISDDGLTIVGNGINPSGRPEGWVATIPEPGTGLLVVAGLLGLGGRRRR